MQGDLALFMDSFGADIAKSGTDLAFVDDLKSAVIIGLFSDRRVEPEELPSWEKSKAGWWGDALESSGDLTGSKLWLLGREKRTSDVLERAEEYAQEALDWLIEDGVAESVTVTSEFGTGDDLVITVSIVRPSGDPVSYRFDQVWKRLSDGV